MEYVSALIVMIAVAVLALLVWGFIEYVRQMKPKKNEELHQKEDDNS